jgi:hypothetical protein
MHIPLLLVEMLATYGSHQREHLLARAEQFPRNFRRIGKNGQWHRWRKAVERLADGVWQKVICQQPSKYAQ